MDLTNLSCYLTHPHPCSYLEGKEATTLFLNPRLSITKTLYSTVSQYGFRRSGQYLYRPHCASCNACVPLRVPVANFTPNRTQRRILKANEDLTLSQQPAAFNEAHYELYERYITERHADGDMYPPSRHQYETFLFSPWSETSLLEFRQGDVLMAVAVIDILTDGLSSVYTFFNPDYAERSLGTLCVLKHIELTHALGLPYVYLGYWVADCRKMSYKTNFQPCEVFDGERWFAYT